MVKIILLEFFLWKLLQVTSLSTITKGLVVCGADMLSHFTYVISVSILVLAPLE